MHVLLIILKIDIYIYNKLYKTLYFIFVQYQYNCKKIL